MHRFAEKKRDNKPRAAAHAAGGSGKPVQRRRVTELQPGVFNMIGETHTDYGGKKGRSLEAGKIRAVMGPSVEYLTENMLKTSPGNTDYADPIDLRVAQIVSFVRSSYEKLEPEIALLGGMNIQQSALVDKGNKDMAANATELFAPLIAKDTFNLDTIMVSIRSQRYSIAVLDALHQSATWKAAILKYDPKDEFSANFFEVTSAIMDEKFAQEDLLEQDDETPDPLAPVVIAKGFAIKVNEFYDLYKGRLPTTLALYYHVATSKEHAGKKGRFNFDLEKIQDVIKQWEKLEKVNDIIRVVLKEDRNTLLVSVVKACSRILPALMNAIDAGTSGAPPEDLLKIVEQRSIAMNQAAETLKAKNIAWKVGDMHVADIDKAEKGGFVTTGYAYITKTDFKSKYPTTKTELEEHVASDENLGVSYLAAKEEKKRLVTAAREDLAKAIPWARGGFASLEHLDMGNIITNQTGVLADALKNGLLPKLKTLTIRKESMTPDLMGRFISFGVKVILT
jgi:hypothetical protein